MNTPALEIAELTPFGAIRNTLELEKNMPRGLVVYSQRRLTWYQSLDFRTICGVMMATSAAMMTTLIIGK